MDDMLTLRLAAISREYAVRFDTNQPRDPHTGQWVPAVAAARLHGRQVIGITPGGREVRGHYDHPNRVVHHLGVRPHPVTHVRLPPRLTPRKTRWSGTNPRGIAALPGGGRRGG